MIKYQNLDNRFTADEQDAALNSIDTIVEHIDVLVYGAGASNIGDALNILEQNPDMVNAVNDDFGVSLALIRKLFDCGVIDKDLVVI